MNRFTFPDLGWYLMVYSLLGWTLEVCIRAVTNRRFVNLGLLNLPFSIPYGLTSVILMAALPTLEGILPQFLLCLAVYRLVRILSDHFVRRVSGAEREQSRLRAAELLSALTMAAVLLVQRNFWNWPACRISRTAMWTHWNLRRKKNDLPGTCKNGRRSRFFRLGRAGCGHH